MLGPIARKYLFRGYAMGIWFYIIPFEWDSKEKQRVQPTQNKFRLFRFYENTFYNVVGVVWCALRAWQLSQKSEGSKEDFTFYILSMLFFSAIIFPLSLYLNYYRARDEMPSFTYDFIEYGEQFQEKYVLKEELERQRSRKHDMSGAYAASLFYLQFFVFSTIPVITLIYPQIPVLLTGTFDLPNWVHYPLAVIQAIVISLFMSAFCVNQCVYLFPGLEYLFSIMYILKELEISDGSGGDYTTTDVLRSPTEFIQNYRALQVIHAKAMHIYSPIVLPSNEWTYIVMATYCIYGAIRMDGVLGYAMMGGAFLDMYYLFTVFIVFSKIRSRSESVLESWRRRAHNAPDLRKTLTSLQPISIGVGEYYYVDYAMVLTMYKSIFEGALDLLMLG